MFILRSSFPLSLVPFLLILPPSLPPLSLTPFLLIFLSSFLPYSQAQHHSTPRL